MLTVAVTAMLVFDPRPGHSGGRPKYLVVLTGALVAGGLLLGGRRDRSWRDTRVRWPLLALVLAAGLSTLLSEHRVTALYGYPGSHDGLLTTLSFAVLFVATAVAFERRSVLGAVRVLWFGAGTGVLLFGLAQLVDRLVAPDSGWDWARPHISPWTIGSTLGNPNHLGGLLAVLLPLAAVLAVLTRGRQRLLVAAGTALAVTELGVTASRGAWTAAVTSAAVLGLLLRRELRPHRRRVAVAAAGTVVLVIAVLAVLGPAGVTKLEPEALARTGPGSTLDLRLEVWAAALRATADRPVTGVGPDVFPVVFPGHASERFIRLYGPFTIANGAHNLFLNTLANQGLAGLAAFLALLLAAAVLLAGAWGGLDRDARLLAAGLVAALVAYLVQASLNTQTVALSLCFWVLLGLLVALISSPRGRNDE